jgi:hypothetical protein
MSVVFLALGAGGCSRSGADGSDGETSPRPMCAEPARGSRFAVCGSLVTDGNASSYGMSLRATMGGAHPTVTSEAGQFELGGGFNALR